VKVLEGIPEVLRSLGNGLAIESNGNTTKLLIAMGDIEVDLYNMLIHAPAHLRIVPTLCVIFGPLLASEACAKKTKANDKIRRNEMTNL
jgi:hypothetical protein